MLQGCYSLLARGSRAPKGERSERPQAIDVSFGRRRLIVALSPKAWALLVTFPLAPPETKQQFGQKKSRGKTIPLQAAGASREPGARCVSAPPPVQG